VEVSHERLRTYLDALDRSTITGGATSADDSIDRRRSPKDGGEQGSDWLFWNRDRVYELLVTLGYCGWHKLQETIQEHCGVTIGHQPLETFLEGAYQSGGKFHSLRIHDKAMQAVRDSGYDEELAKAQAIYAYLRSSFLAAPLTMAGLTAALLKKSISLSVEAARRLLVRLEWDLEQARHFVPASYRPVLCRRDVFDYPIRSGVASWIYCSTCGRMKPVKEPSAIGPHFKCPKSIIDVKICPPAQFKFGCRYDSYRQRDIETNGATPINAICGAVYCAVAAKAASALGSCGATDVL